MPKIAPCAALAAALSMAVLSMTLPAQPGLARIPTGKELAACPEFARFDWKKLDRMGALVLDPAAGEAARTEFHRKIRGPIPIPDLARAEIVLSLAVGSGETQETPTSTSSFVWKEPGGEWQIDRVDWRMAHEPAPPEPGQPAPSAEDIEREARGQARGPLDQGRVKELEEGLNDPCLPLQPDAPPLQVPVKGEPIAPCWPGTGAGLVVRRGGTLRAISDPCGRWAAGRIMQAVMYGYVRQDHLVREYLRERIGSAADEELKFAFGNSPDEALAVICGIHAAGPGKRFLIVMKRHDTRQKSILLESDRDAGAPGFGEQWSSNRCDAALR